jgi:plasmid maintenance system antidote protein VapI
MTPQDFTRWLDAMNITAKQAAKALGVTQNTITRYKANGGPVMLHLACKALFHRL